MKKVKKVLSFLLVFCMILTIMPMGVYATDLEESSAAADDLISEATPTPVPAEDIPADDPVEEDPTPAPTEQPTPEPTEEPASYSITPYSGEASVPLDTSKFYRIFHLDCGRKYFSVEQIKVLIDTLAANHYTHIELAVGNDGLRFLLDDMSFTANGKTYLHDSVVSAVESSNATQNSSGDKSWLTQTEMDTIISYADEKGIGVIPLINTPGHMDAILSACQQLCDPNAAYGFSSTTIDVTNTNAVAFTQALVQKYVNYFAGKGCKFFNLGADEYAGTSFGALQSEGSYDEYADYVNGVAAIIKEAGMVPMAFNDGIYYNGSSYSGNSSITFDADIVICYWTNGYPGYSPASVEYLQNRGFKNFIHTNESWYYVLGRNNNEWAGYNTAENATKTIAVDSMSIDEVGAMICVWCDTPSASYDNNAAKISTLISNLATNNPIYFVADSGETDPVAPTDPIEVTKSETITVTVGGTATATIEGADYSSNIVETELDKSIATVSAKYDQVTGGPEEVKATSITSGSSYYIKNSSGQYLSSSATWVSDISSAALWTATSSNNGYKLKSGSNYLSYNGFTGLGVTTRSNWATTWSFSNGTFSYSGFGGSSYTLGDAYTVTTTDPVDATIVTFTAAADAAGKTTYVTVGNTRYTINVVAEDLSKVTPLTVEYWITNLQVTAGGATSKAISAQSAYGEAGVDVSTLVPATGTYAYGSVVYWKGTVLDADNKQTTASGAENDKTGSGKDFNLIRYYNGSWQYFYEADGTWNTISSTDQVVIYWLQPTEVTKEITTLVKDWGYSPSNQQGDNTNKVALTVAVVYPDGTVSPAEGDMYSTSTTLFNYWSGRDIGLVAPVNNSDYEIAKITVTNGTRNQSGEGQWGTNDTITWEKVTNEAGEQWYNETTYWDETVGGTPMVNGVTSNITWSNYNTAKLVLIYLKPVHYDTNLIVKWVDDSAGGAQISSMEVAVSSDETPTTFYNGLKQTSALPDKGVGGTFTLDDDAYVTNSSNVNQTFNKNISTVPGVADVYKTGLYYYVSADLSSDGKTLTLHYNIDSSKLSKQYVVDFGLPVNVPLSDFVENSSSVTKVEIAGGDATVNADKSITYQPNAVMTGTATVGVKLTFGDNTTQTVRIGFVPATTVYYEEGFAAYDGSWNSTNKGTGNQATEIAGKKVNVYGYDPRYNAVGPSNDTEAVSSAIGDKATFEFTGTGVEIYTNNTDETGSVLVMIRKKSTNTTVKTIFVNTAMQEGVTGATSGQNVTAYNVPIISARDLDYGTYTVEITHIKSDVNETESGEVKIDGFRVHGTLNTADSVYAQDGEANPTFVELRDSVLQVALDADAKDSVDYKNQIAEDVMSQVYAMTGDGGVNALVLSQSLTGASGTTVTDLLDNGPKNEIYLKKNDTLVFTIKTQSAQIGLKALNQSTTYTVNGVSSALNTSTDMFYTILSSGTITISNTGDGILSVTLIKLFGAEKPEKITTAAVAYALRAMSDTSESTEEPAATPDPTIEPTATPEPTAEPTPVVTPTPAPTNPPKPVVPNNPIQDFFNTVRNILNKWFGW